MEKELKHMLNELRLMLILDMAAMALDPSPRPGKPVVSNHLYYLTHEDLTE